MTPDPVRAKLSERLVYEATDPTNDDAYRRISHGTLHVWSAEVSALEARLAAAEGLADGWRKRVADARAETVNGFVLCSGEVEKCADELSAILKGEGK